MLREPWSSIDSPRFKDGDQAFMSEPDQISAPFCFFLVLAGKSWAPFCVVLEGGKEMLVSILDLSLGLGG